jgi:hypothetical protein
VNVTNPRYTGNITAGLMSEYIFFNLTNYYGAKFNITPVINYNISRALLTAKVFWPRLPVSITQ